MLSQVFLNLIRRIGVTYYCVYPSQVVVDLKTLQRVGNTVRCPVLKKVGERKRNKSCKRVQLKKDFFPTDLFSKY
jgi:hypothetical protein